MNNPDAKVICCTVEKFMDEVKCGGKLEDVRGRIRHPFDAHESVVTVMVTRTTQSPFRHVIVLCMCLVD